MLKSSTFLKFSIARKIFDQKYFRKRSPHISIHGYYSQKATLHMKNAKIKYVAKNIKACLKNPTFVYI